MMMSIKLAFRKLFAKEEQTIARIISLSAGLIFGILLLGEVFYYYSFDSFYPNSDRIYVVHSNYRDNTKQNFEQSDRVSGAIAPALKAEVPGIEAATRLNGFGTTVFYTTDQKSYKAKFVFADEHLFEVLPRPMISGDGAKILKQPMECIISKKIADAIGHNVIGEIIELKSFPGKKLTIRGIFEDLPENTNYKYDVLVSMVSTSQFMWDGTENWLGNDRYYACVKLAKNIKAESLAPAVRKMQEKHQDIEKLEKIYGGEVFKYSFVPIKKMFPNRIKEMIIILSIIAFSVLFTAILNYILLTVGSLVNRAKTSAIHKCYGAQTSNLQGIIFMETILVFLISLIITGISIYALKPFFESQVFHKMDAMFSPYVVYPILGILIVLVFFIAYFPGRFYARIPVASAFRTYKQKGNKWKLGLLAVQFIGASLIFTVLTIVSLQYRQMLNTNHGYDAENIYFGSTSGMDGKKLGRVLNELRSMPEIEKVALGYGVPIYGASGNNVVSPGGDKELFNVADFYHIDHNYFSLLNIPIQKGENFSKEHTASNAVMISAKAAKLLKLHNGWQDDIIGKEIQITEHNDNGKSSAISGVFEDFVIGNMAIPDKRPAVFFYLSEDEFIQELTEDPSFSFKILVKTTHQGKDIMKKLTDVFNMAMPYKDAVIYSLADAQYRKYTQVRGVRNTVMIGGGIILLITIMGLIGYTVSESNRNRKQLAIRRINGATFSNLMTKFLWDILRIAIPMITLGIIGAWFISGLWMQYLSDKITLNWGIFLFCGFFIIAIISLVSAYSYRGTANRNPVESLRDE